MKTVEPEDDTRARLDRLEQKAREVGERAEAAARGVEQITRETAGNAARSARRMPESIRGNSTSYTIAKVGGGLILVAVVVGILFALFGG